MASKQRMSHSPTDVHLRKTQIMRPIISSDVMGNRNVEVVPVGAWVELVDDDEQPDAVKAAQIEEERICRLINEKENRLRNFQQQTRHRVSTANRLRRRQQIQEAEQAFELERKVVQQSCLAGDLPRKDTCVVRQDLDLAIRKRLLEKYGEDVETWKRDNVPDLNSYTEESHQVAGRARQQLMSKKISQGDTDDPTDRVKQNSKTGKDIQVPAMKSIVDVDYYPTMNSDSHIKAYDDKKSEENGTTGTSVEQGCSPELKSSDRSDETDSDGENSEPIRSTENDVQLQFLDQPQTDHYQRKKRSKSSRRPKSSQLAAILFHDAESDVLARQRRQQAAVSRRIFMDRERDAVRENIRRQQHRKKIQALKKEKECYRQELEDLAHRQLEPAKDESRENAEEVTLRERLEALQMMEMADKKQRNEQKKAREMKRYLDALRHTLIEKVTRQGLRLPSLCACGDTVWDTHPDTCANNCFFYKNPRAYARALQSLLASSEVL